ncbi:uncharacterized protein ACMZJ9_013677 isoform 1-T2 [Mantella aurantiaca]
MDPVEDDENHHGFYLRVAIEDDETHTVRYDMPMSLHSNEFSPLTSVPDLQISCSVPHFQPDLRWCEEVLAAFDKLPDFSPEQAEDLSEFGLFLGRQPVCVKDYLETFTSVPENKEKLRSLTEKLKTLGRADVVKAMHLQKGDLRWLGPVLPEATLISEFVPSLWVPLTAALSTPHPLGFSWKWLAQKIDIPPTYIGLWQQKANPAGEVLTSWMVRKEATIGRLFDLLLEYREDLAAML